MEQLKLVEFPSIEQKKLIPAFAIDEIYIKNNCLSKLSFVDDHFSLQMDKVIEWNDYIQEPFKSKIISLIENITPRSSISV